MQTNTIVMALEQWVEATSPYCEPRKPGREEEVLFVERTRWLLFLLKEISHKELDGKGLWGDSFAIRRSIMGLSAQFLWDDYTDSNTDEPCDVEWDVHTLLSKLDKDHKVPDEVRPAYVGNYYEGPKEDED